MKKILWVLVLSFVGGFYFLYGEALYGGVETTRAFVETFLLIVGLYALVKASSMYLTSNKDKV